MIYMYIYIYIFQYIKSSNIERERKERKGCHDLTWASLVSNALTWFHLAPLEFACLHLVHLILVPIGLGSLASFQPVSLGVICFHLASLFVCWFHLPLLGLICSHLVAIAFTWFRSIPRGLTSFEFTWSNLDLLGPTWPYLGSLHPLTYYW